MRTGFSLFQELTVSPEQHAAPGAVRKGRNEELLAKRNDCLIHRYLFYCIYTELRPEIINNHLCEEFYLKECRMLAVVYEHAVQLRALRTSPPTITQLRAKYPHLVWIATK